MCHTGVYKPVLAEFNPLAPVMAEPLFKFHLGSWVVTIDNHMFMVTVAVLLLLVFIPLIVRSKKLIPAGPYNLVEALCVIIREQLARPILSGYTDEYIGFLWTLFFFILTLNLLGLVPSDKLVTLATGRASYFGGPATANIWITGSLAVVVFLVSISAGIAKKGLRGYLVSLVPPVPGWIFPFMFLIEIITLFIRPITLAIRLFANILAGHMLIGTFIGLILIFKNYFVASASIISIVVLSLLELLVAFIQAYIFTFLTALYLSFSVKTEH